MKQSYYSLNNSTKWQLHKEGEPAIEWPNGDKEWWLNDKRHRLDGPAIEWINGLNKWYVSGKQCSKEEFPTVVTMFLLNCDRAAADLIIELYKD
jgi:hypothetical protein